MAVLKRVLPAMNRVVVEITVGKGKKRTVEHVWHDTRNDVEVTDIKSAECPLTGDSVMTGVAAGVRVWFKPLQLDTRAELEDGDIDAATLVDSLTMLDYDVPSHGETEGFSPCAELRRYAVPMTKSVWLVRSGDVPWNFIANMRSMGVRIDTSKLDPTETRRKVERAVLFMVEQLNARIESTTRTAANALQRLSDAAADTDDPDHEAAVRRYRKAASAITHSLNEWIESTWAGAKAFTLAPGAFGLPRLREHAARIRADMDARAAAYAAGSRALATAGTLDAAALAPLAAADQCPVHVMSDALREAGQDKLADDLNETFDLV